MLIDSDERFFDCQNIISAQKIQVNAKILKKGKRIHVEKGARQLSVP